MLEKRMWLRILPYSITCIGLFIGAFYDYPIDQFLYDPNNLLGIFFERFVLVPIVMVLPISFFAFYRLHKQMWQLAAYVLSCTYVVMDIAHHWISLSTYFLWLLPVCVLFMIVLYLCLASVSLTFWKKHERFLTFTTVVFLFSILTTFVMKQFWGRVRFREMLDDVRQFTPWYQANGWNSHQSFPSGHTTAMSVILCTLQIHKDQNRYQKASVLHGCIVFLLIFLMMFCRMLVGAHFLSDVTMGLTITYTYYILWRARFYREDFI